MFFSAWRAQPAGLPAGWVRWVSLGVFTALVVVALLPMRPGPAVASVAAAVSVAAAALLLWRRAPLLPCAALATAGVAVLSYSESYHLGWFAVCLVAVWCGRAGQPRDTAVFLAVTLCWFAVEWAWVRPDPGWGAWIGGLVLSALLGVLVRQQAELVAQLREAQAGLADRARAEERNRIGRELHDVIAHTLTVVLLHVTGARLAVEHDPADAARALAEAERLSRESLEEVRLAVGMLHRQGDAGPVSPLPDADALPALVERFRLAGADITFTVDGDTSRLSAATGLTVYRIAQEALTNAVKHAADVPTAATLTIGPASVRLAVDSAVGPVPAALSGSGLRPGPGLGLGMITMRERAKSVGGTCQAGPGGSGWLVEATLPLIASQGPRLEGVS
jgi:signal transduction histidine kinase